MQIVGAVPLAMCTSIHGVLVIDVYLYSRVYGNLLKLLQH